MADRTTIEWTDATWNPVTGCTKVSPGCAHCYAEAMTKRFGGNFSVTLHPERLDQPLRWRKARRIFVPCSMGDLFHEDVPRPFIDRVFDVMTLRPDHRFLLLTKRPERATEYLTHLERWPLPVSEETYRKVLVNLIRAVTRWPLPNTWLGVSVENQRAAEERIPLLLQTPAAVRFVSCEPLLEAVDLGPWLPRWTEVYRREATATTQAYSLKVRDDSPTLAWVIPGGESGSKARAAEIEWFRSLRDQCKAAGIPYFQKPLGSVLGRELGCRDRKGGDMGAWPEDLRVREWP